MPIMRILLTCIGMGTRMKSSVTMLKPVKVMMNVKSSRPEVFYKKRCSLQNSQENNCARASFLIKLQAQACNCNFIKKETLNFSKFLRTPFLTEYLRWLFLECAKCKESYNEGEEWLCCPVCHQWYHEDCF